MIKILIISFFILLTSCDKNENSEGNFENLILNESIIVNGQQRDYHIYIPNATINKPLTILLHGNGGNFDDVIGQTNVKSPQKIWLDLAELNQFILVVPNGTLGSENKRGWNDCRSDANGNPEMNDVLFIEELLTKLISEYNYDENRVYIAGVSNGGQMAIRLALEIPEKITAFASVIASMSDNSQCGESTIPVSALFMNGTEDPILPYNGGQMTGNRGLVKSTEETVQYWTNRNGIIDAPIEQNINDVNNSDNCNAVRYSYLNGNNNTAGMLYKINNGGHAEPSQTERYGNFFLSIVGNQNGDFEMANEIWEFFKEKSN
jgi:polyhydroxybutyrate depolymerase